MECRGEAAIPHRRVGRTWLGTPRCYPDAGCPDLAVPIWLPQPGCPSAAAWCGRFDVGFLRAALAGRRRDQTLAAPIVDLSPRPRLRGQGRPHLHHELCAEVSMNHRGQTRLDPRCRGDADGTHLEPDRG